MYSTLGLNAPYNYHLLLFQNCRTNVVHYLQIACSEHNKCPQLPLNLLTTDVGSIRKRHWQHILSFTQDLNFIIHDQKTLSITSRK